MSIILVPHTVTIDLSSATQWGELKFANDRYIYGDEVSESQLPPKGFCDNMDRAVLDFDVEEDFLLLVGDYLQMTMLAAKLMYQYGKVRVLRYDRMAQGYFPVWITE